jgi:hypothetical protein
VLLAERHQQIKAGSTKTTACNFQAKKMLRKKPVFFLLKVTGGGFC